MFRSAASAFRIGAPSSRSCARRPGSRSDPGQQIVLSAGAIGSPQILQLGIGPGTLLQSMGIEVLRDAAGRKPSDHLQIRCAYRMMARAR
ncbi:MAG: GMC family oxidoreductase N-terminal domain-containing protein [Paracoccus sp. (in: a-proteobacteria)]